MRRSILCSLSLALCFTLTFLLQGSSALGGDTLPPGCCKLFSDADFAPMVTDSLVPSRFEVSMLAPGVTAAPPQLVFLPHSGREWSFNYEPNRRAPLPSRKKHIAPVLFRVTGNASDMAFAIRFFAGQANSVLQLMLTPVEQMPFQAIRVADRCLNVY